VSRYPSLVMTAISINTLPSHFPHNPLTLPSHSPHVRICPIGSDNKPRAGVKLIHSMRCRHTVRREGTANFANAVQQTLRLEGEIRSATRTIQQTVTNAQADIARDIQRAQEDLSQNLNNLTTAAQGLATERQAAVAGADREITLTCETCTFLASFKQSNTEECRAMATFAESKHWWCSMCHTANKIGETLPYSLSEPSTWPLTAESIMRIDECKPSILTLLELPTSCAFCTEPFDTGEHAPFQGCKESITHVACVGCAPNLSSCPFCRCQWHILRTRSTTKTSNALLYLLDKAKTTLSAFDTEQSRSPKMQRIS
jgi:hypothetical protein